MADEPDPNAGNPESSSDSPRGQPPSRRKSLTPELRRFLGPGRSWHDKEAAREEANQAAELASDQASSTESRHDRAEEQWNAPAEASPAPPKAERRRVQNTAPAVVPDQKISRALEMQTVALIAGGFILLGTAFYAGTKIGYLKTFLASRAKPEITNVDGKKFPGLTSDELVEQALAAERLGQWREAVERLVVAKRRNMSYRGLLFHAGKLCYDHGDFESADRLFDRAIVFGDQVDTANYLRGLIAVGRNDLSAAEQFFEAAVNAEPFTPGYYYYLGETLRREHRPNDAAVRYEQAASRTVNEQDALLCRFKARMAKAEVADRSQLQAEVEQKRSAGPLSLDWLMTDAALNIRAGKFPEAAQLIRQAQPEGNTLPTVFASYISDMLFTDAASNHSEIAEVCRLNTSGSAPTPAPFASP
jgi:tetratricopeptide (TPR) repeat protein